MGQRPAILAALLLFAFALAQSFSGTSLPDFFIFRLGAELAARGENPYDIPKIREHIAAQFPDPEPKADSFVNNCGYFLPPMAVLVFLPFAALPLVYAKILWAAAVGLGGYFIARLPEMLRPPGSPALGARRSSSFRSFWC